MELLQYQVEGKPKKFHFYEMLQQKKLLTLRHKFDSKWYLLQWKIDLCTRYALFLVYISTIKLKHFHIEIGNI